MLFGRPTTSDMMSKYSEYSIHAHHSSLPSSFIEHLITLCAVLMERKVRWACFRGLCFLSLPYETLPVHLSTQQQVAVLVVGAGPTGLGAATRLHQHGHTDWLLIDQVGASESNVFNLPVSIWY